MLWQKGRSSDNEVKNKGGGRGLGLGVVVVVIIASLLFDNSPAQIRQWFDVLSTGDAAGQMTPLPQVASAQDDQQTEFVRKVLHSTEDVWSQIFRSDGKQYPAPRFVLFHGKEQSVCGAASVTMGPFYCPDDRQIYLDLDFFQEMQERFQAAGDFARAYVIAHEVGHHVQNLLGTSEQVEQAVQHGESLEGEDGLSMRQELQADCLAGVWAYHAQQQQLDWLKSGDVETALNAATQIGEDTVQKQSRGYVMPDSFTHGTAAERVRWFKAGFSSGDIKSCNTFEAAWL
ncbi:MAG: zinc metallopeptidase [Rhodanobacter sp.]|jgi:predicted metalloprotease|nr:zinc metallopeptidase [Rhodanobacter sp.]